MFCILLIFAQLFIGIHSVPLSEFFPFGTSVGDTLFPPNDDISTNALPLPSIFPYFNNNHRQIYLSNNGLFSFLGPISQFVPDPFPLNDSRRLVAGFWSDIDTRASISNGNQVFYQIYGNASSTTVFTKAASYVQRFFPSERSFTPSMVITGTWNRVGAYPMQTNRTNTFQIVLTTDEMRSYAFILYNDLQWANPTNSLASTGGQAGFNAGDGIVFQMLPYSRTTNVVELVNISNVNIPGVFVFRIDTDTIYIGGCGNTSTLIFRPQRGSQLGSTALIVQGPCFNNLTDGDVKCRFGTSVVVDGVIVNEFQAICLTPPSALPGPIVVYLSTDRGQSYRLFSNTFTYTSMQVGMASNDGAEITIENQTSFILGTGDNVALSWFFSDGTRRLWPNVSMEIEVQLITIQLDSNTNGISLDTPHVVYQHLPVVIGIQTLSITFPSLNSNDPAGFFRVLVRDNATNTVYAGLSSSIFVINMTSTNAQQFCSSWDSQQPSPTTWNQDLLLCPMTLTQARVARCCYDPDSLCQDNDNRPASNCALHRGRATFGEDSAVACYVSSWTNTWNAGTKCCYNNQSQLITRGLGAGNDHRYRPAIAPVQNFFDDILPYLACCVLSSESESCEHYYELRPSRRGSNSRSTSGASWGDPHYTTLDGSAYTFNGYGEYIYLAVATSTPSPPTFNMTTQTFTFLSQVRSAPVFLTNGTAINTATVTRGFAAKSDHAQAQAVSITVSRREFLIVRRGSEVINFDGGSSDTVNMSDSITLFYPELTIEQNRTSQVITLSWSMGVTIQVAPITLTSPVNNTLVLNIGVSVAESYQNCTYGLLGTFDGNTTNDLRIPNGTVVGLADNMTLEQIHRYFGQMWAIDPLYSLFYYESGDSAMFYSTQNQIFTPSFTPPQPTSPQAQSTCGINSSNQSSWTVAQRTCYYDVGVTNDLSFGQTSLNAAERLVEISIDLRSPPVFSPDLQLILTVPPSTLVVLNFTAVSPYTTVVVYSLLTGPLNCNFDNLTAIFTWQAPSTPINDTTVTVSAQDNQYNLTSTVDVVIRVRIITTTTTITTAVTTSSTRCIYDRLWISLVYCLLSLTMLFMCSNE